MGSRATARPSRSCETESGSPELQRETRSGNLQEISKLPSSIAALVRSTISPSARSPRPRRNK